jgi:anaerobic selenocysteine-containing dehydrogenase
MDSNDNSGEPSVVDLTRRELLKITAATGGMLLAGGLVSGGALAAADDSETTIARWRCACA